MTFSRFLKSVSLALVLYCLALISTPAQYPPSSPNGNVAVQTAQSKLFFTVIDKDSHFVALQAADVRVLEDGKPQEIIALRKLEDQPLSLAILIDTSVSQERTLPNQKFAADSFVQAIMHTGKDQAAVVTFTGKMIVEQGFTNDIALVRQAISRAKFVPPPGYIRGGVIVQGTPGTQPAPRQPQQIAGSTAIWDAVWDTTDQLFPLAAAATRKAILLLTDGVDSSSQRKIREAIEHTVAANVAIYSIGIGDEHTYGIEKGALRKLSEQTGGRAFIPKKEQDLEAAFTAIQQELRY